MVNALKCESVIVLNFIRSYQRWAIFVILRNGNGFWGGGHRIQLTQAGELKLILAFERMTLCVCACLFVFGVTLLWGQNGYDYRLIN